MFHNKNMDGINETPDPVLSKPTTTTTTTNIAAIPQTNDDNTTMIFNEEEVELLREALDTRNTNDELTNINSNNNNDNNNNDHTILLPENKKLSMNYYLPLDQSIIPGMSIMPISNMNPYYNPLSMHSYDTDNNYSNNNNNIKIGNGMKTNNNNNILSSIASTNNNNNNISFIKTNLRLQYKNLFNKFPRGALANSMLWLKQKIHEERKEIVVYKPKLKILIINLKVQPISTNGIVVANDDTTTTTTTTTTKTSKKTSPKHSNRSNDLNKNYTLNPGNEYTM